MTVYAAKCEALKVSEHGIADINIGREEWNGRRVHCWLLQFSRLLPVIILTPRSVVVDASVWVVRKTFKVQLPVVLC